MKLLRWISVALIPATLSSRADLPEGWQLRDSPAANQLMGVTYGNGLFVAVGAGAIILTSPNGIDWTQRSAGTGAPQLFTIAYGGGFFVAGGEAGALVRVSTDGINWTNGTATSPAQQIFGVAHGNGLFVAVGSGTQPGSSSILTSANAVEWNVQSSPATNALLAITHGNGSFVAVGDQGAILTSPDGVTWTPQNSGTSNPLRSVAFHQSQYITAGDAGTVLRSFDGSAWFPAAPTAFDVRGLASSGDGLVAVGNDIDSGALHGSEDGVNWPGFSTQVLHPLNAIAYGANSFVAVGDEGLIIQSEPSLAHATNRWLKTTSGLWEEQFNWSLGALPAPEQGMIALRTPGSKVLEIAASTAAEYPYSLAIQSLSVDAPAGSANQLLLNDAGLSVPLEIAADFRLGANASLLSYHSALRAGAFHVSGRATFAAGAVGLFNLVRLGVDAPGELNLTNASISSGRLVVADGAPGIVNQAGGTSSLETLQLNGNGLYRLRAGALVASNIIVGLAGELRLEDGAMAGAGRLTLRGGIIRAAGGTQRLGTLAQDAAATSLLDLAGGAVLLQFSASRDVAWNPGAVLVISNWNGSVYGGGADRLFAGTNTPGFTVTQSAQLVFANPGGVPAGNYPARILVTGEIVPRTGPALEFTRTPSALVFSWEGDYRLLTSTNLKGPYVVITASSPYIQLPTEPQRFFLLTSP